MWTLTNARRTAADFGSDRGGNFAIITGVTMVALMGAFGMAVDLSQSYHLKSSMSAALDAAVTSTAYDITTGKIGIDQAQKSVEKFLNVNGRAVFSTQGVYSLEPLEIDRTARTIKATAYANANLAFPFFSDNTPRVRVASAAIYSDKQIEVAMMLDVTGSMGKTRTTDKIGDLKKAAENAVDTMLKNQDPKNPRIRVALVPYASGVNAGDLAINTYVEQASGSDLPPVAGGALLLAKTGQSLLPSFKTYLDIVSAAFPHKDACATERKDINGKADFSADGPDAVRSDKNGKKYYALVNRDNNLSGSGMNKCPDAKVVPLTADSKALIDTIDDFQAGGYTAGAIAVQWTYYMLSAQWRDAIADAKLGKGPADYNSKKIAKVAILMTDGQFNTAYAGVSGSFNQQDAKARLNAETICTNMKADGIEIYTIGFDLDSKDMTKEERDAAKAGLRNCASPDVSGTQHFYQTSTGDELNAAFQKIIANQEKIALTQ